MEPQEQDDARQRVNLIVFAVVVVLVVFCVWLLLAFKKSSDTLDCYAAHHRNCEPGDSSSSG